jgi:hypothetical protein
MLAIMRRVRSPYDIRHLRLPCFLPGIPRKWSRQPDGLFLSGHGDVACWHHAPCRGLRNLLATQTWRTPMCAGMPDAASALDRSGFENDSPVGQNQFDCVDASSLRRPWECKIRVRVKSNFLRRFKVIWIVRSFRPKNATSGFQNRVSRSHNGRIAIVMNVGWDAVAAMGRETGACGR